MTRLRAYLRIMLAMGLRGLIKTLWLNWRLLPLGSAVRLPIYCAANTRLYSLRGRVEFGCPIRHGMVKLGFAARDMFVPSNNVTNLNIDGIVRFGGAGECVGGVSINVASRAVLTIGGHFFISSQVKIVCQERIDIGSWARIAWESQLFDTTFHYIRDVATGQCLKKTAPIVIGDNVWVGNRTTVGKGTAIPDYCIVASNSVCSGDYSAVPRNSMIGGVPARLIKTGYYRVASYEEEAMITNSLDSFPEGEAAIRVSGR